MGEKRCISLVVRDWRKESSGVSMTNTEKGIELTMGQLHGGSAFKGWVELDEDDWQHMVSALGDGYVVMFYAVPQPAMEVDEDEFEEVGK